MVVCDLPSSNELGWYCHTSIRYHHLMNTHISMSGTVNKLSLIISESVTEIRINKQPCGGINLTNMTYTRPRICHVWQPFTMTSYGRSRSHLSLVHVFHVIPHTGLSVGGPYTIPLNISRAMVGYRSTTTIIQLRRITGSHKAPCGQYN
jgi:hypothetical protein